MTLHGPQREGTERAQRPLRWVGSKAHLATQLAPLLRGHLDATGGRLLSLFYGSGALEQLLPGNGQLAAEANPDLVALHSEVARDPDGVFEELYRLDARTPRSRAGYLELRSVDPDQLSRRERAARCLWLSGTAFNGLWRVNKSGALNVPPDPGRLVRAWPFPSREVLRSSGLRLAGVRFVRDWRLATAEAGPGDLVLADPPYIGGFTAYTAQGFSVADQQQLATSLARLAARGCAVMAFNSPAARSLYERWATVRVADRSGRFCCVGSRRQRVAELIFHAGLRGDALETAA